MTYSGALCLWVKMIYMMSLGKNYLQNPTGWFENDLHQYTMTLGENDLHHIHCCTAAEEFQWQWGQLVKKEEEFCHGTSLMAQV